MVESRWLRWIGPGILSLGAVGFIASTTLGAGDRPWMPRACAGPPGGAVVAAREPGPAEPADLRHEAWVRLDPLLDRDGALRGQRLAAGVGHGHAGSVSGLPPESFVDGPIGRIVLVGSDDGTVSRLRALDVESGCAWAIATERDVIRRATMDADGGHIYETRVDRATRADLGVWLRPLDGGPARRILDPLPVDARFGRTFSTDLRWDVAGDRLAIQSCGEVACRTRIITRSGRLAATLEAPDLGVLVGFDEDRVVTYGACRGLPCPIVSTDVLTGGRRVIEPSGGPAVIVATRDGARLVHEVPAATGRGLRSIDLDGTFGSDLGPIPDDLGLRPGATRFEGATRLPPGWVLLAPDVGAAPDGPIARQQLRRVPDGLAVPLEEATR